MAESRHTGAADNAELEVVYDLMRTKLFDLFGPGGSFRITLGRASTDDAAFVSTVADTIAHEVAATFLAPRESAGRRVAGASEADKLAAHEALWREIEAELLIRRTGPDSIDAVVVAQHDDHVGGRRRSRAA